MEEYEHNAFPVLSWMEVCKQIEEQHVQSVSDGEYEA